MARRSRLQRQIIECAYTQRETRRVFTNQQKVALLSKWRESGLNPTAFERVHRLPRGAVAKWETDETSIKKANPEAGSRKGPADTLLETRVMKWLEERWKWRGMRISGGMLQEVAKSFAIKLDIKGFTGSNGWLVGFQGRNRLKSVRLHGERASADHAAAQAYPPQFRALISALNITPDLIFNVDETLFYPRLQFQSTIVPMEEARKLRGGKRDKFRIGVLVTTSADGTSTCPVLFSHSAVQPRGMLKMGYRQIAPGVKVSGDGGHLYYPSGKGWISREAIVYYLTVVLPKHIREKVASRPFRAFLVLDGCGIHFTALLDIYIASSAHCPQALDVSSNPVCIRCTDNMQVVGIAASARTSQQDEVIQRIRRLGANLEFEDGILYVRALPPSTCELQPCDQGLISSMKAHWRRELDQRMLKARSAAEAATLARNITVMDVMQSLAAKLRAIPTEVGRKYWRVLMDERNIDVDAETLPEEGDQSLVETLVANMLKIWD